MRRVIGLILVGLGAFLVIMALLLPTYIASRVVKFPINTYVVTTLLGSNVSYFSPSLVRPVTGATMQVTDTVKGDAAAGSSSTAVWDEFTYLYDRTNHIAFSYTTRRAAFDRRTAVLVDCCGANIGGNRRSARPVCPGTSGRSAPRSRPTTCSTPRCCGRCRSGTRARGPSTASACTASWRRCRPPSRAPSRCPDAWWAAARIW